jgi:multiple sugar transport system substrate-binding protein
VRGAQRHAGSPSPATRHDRSHDNSGGHPEARSRVTAHQDEGPVLRGISWNHQRGVGVLREMSDQWFSSTSFGPKSVSSIVWETRSLQAFADQSIAHLSRDYDLLVIDHPFVGRAQQSEALLPIEQLLPDGYLWDQQERSVGPSHRSYRWGGHQWALALDAAAQVSARRPDLLPEPPNTWRDVMDMAAHGPAGVTVALPFVPIDAICLFLTLCANMGSEPFSDPMEPIPLETGARAIDLLLQLTTVVDRTSLGMNPIQVLEEMTHGDRWAYSPALFGYSNYSKRTLGETALRFHPVPSSGFGGVGGIVGGAGIAVSAHSQWPDDAGRFAAWVCSSPIQCGAYVEHGGQPGNRDAWTHLAANLHTNDYFRDTLPALDAGYLRPRYAGFIDFQDEAGPLLRESILSRRPATWIVTELSRLAVSVRAE